MVEDDRHAAIPMDRVIADELELRGTHGLQAHRYPALLRMIESGNLHPERLVQRTIHLDEAGEALTSMGDTPGPGITVIDAFD
jgi:alcohol dehydrogenase